MEMQAGLYFIILNIVIVILSVVIHEVSHGYMAYSEGDMTAFNAGRLTLNPLKHLEIFGSILLPFFLMIIGLPMIAWAKPVPFDPANLRNPRWGVFKVAIAGILANIVIAIVFAFIIQVSVLNNFFSQSVLDIFGFIVYINLLLALFNLMPIPPLDGSKIITAFFPASFRNKLYAYEAYGFPILLIFIIYIWPKIFPILDIVFAKLTTFLL